MNIKDVEILVVNYNTPDLIRNLISSRDQFGYYKIPLRVIDGSDNPDMIKQIQAVCGERDNVYLVNLGYNIHHGPGMNYGIRMSISAPFDRKYILMMDSDSTFAKEGAIEHLLSFMKDDVYMVGGICYVNGMGIGQSEQSKDYPVPYCHPSRCLINKKHFLTYKPPIKHGAPFISTMFDIHNKNHRHVLVHVPDLSDWIPTVGRGTVNRYGYSL